MEIRISREALGALVSSVAKVVESRNTIPILGTVHMEFDGEFLTMRGTDLDIEISQKVAAEGKPGSVCVDAKLLAGIAKKVGDDVSIKVESNTVKLKSGRSNFKLNALPADDFPTMDIGPGSAGSAFDAEFEIDLAALVAPVQFAMSTEEARFFLNGVFLHDDDGKLVAVATDGHRLGRHTAASVGVLPDIIIPRKTVGLLPKGNVHVSVSASKIRIEAGDTVLVSKLIDGTFPDYKRVVPKNNENVVSFDRDAMQRAVDRVTTVSAERGRAARLDIAAGSISLTANGGDGNEAADEVETDYSGDDLTIGFNSAYLRDAFGVMPSGVVELAIQDGGSPALLTSPGYEGLTVVLMPVRVV